jgi:hypothetical protein
MSIDMESDFRATQGATADYRRSGELSQVEFLGNRFAT